MRIVRPAIALALGSLLLPLVAGPAAAAPSPAIENYVVSVYDDLFGRAPDPTGVATWTSALSSGTPRIAVANAITSSQEFRSGLIIDAYAAYLGRGPDAAGLQFWLRNMSAGMTIEQLDSGFIASDEYWAVAGGTSADWVRALYADVLGREAGDSEIAFWLGQLNGGATRAQVAMGFLLSTEYLSSVVDGYYWWLLGRGLDPSGLRTWVSAIQHGARDEQIIGGIVASEEYWVYATSGPVVGFIELTPTSSSLNLGDGQSYQIWAYGTHGEFLADVKDVASLTWDGHPCPLWACVPTSQGVHQVIASYRGAATLATLTVTPPRP
ncbi:DUF4214 domain-containing protein [Cellulomonas sp.]|uniref:DUF4214 domain-containing protein n=1 Tax=Cellulomonas sp. TaxID=40001 RepID=UPI003BABA1D2